MVEEDRAIAVSPLAYTLGAREGMRAGGIAAIAPTSIILQRNVSKERETLDGLVLAMFQFSPDVAIDGVDGVTIDVGPSLFYFGGVAALCRKIRSSVLSLGLTATIGTAPTGRAAWLLARAVRTASHRRPLVRRRLSHKGMTRSLDSLPCDLLPTTGPHSQWLHDLRIRDLADLRRLPRPGLIRRTSRGLIAELDVAYGMEPEAFNWVVPSETFASTVETMGRIEHAEHLLAWATTLVLQLTGWLAVRQLAVSAFELSLSHERGHAAVPPTTLEIRLAEPVWKEPHLLLLLKERLAKVELSAPVIAVRLDASQLVHMQAPTDFLFPELGGTEEDSVRLFELLEARLGAENVLVPVANNDHRPEVFNAWAPATQRVLPAPVLPMKHPRRPFWILPKPIPLIVRDNRPHYTSPLKMIHGPERIEAAWWQGETAARDYYVALAASSVRYWVYLERKTDGAWHLHGIFA